MAEISIAQLPCDNSNIFPVDVIFSYRKRQGPVMETDLENIQLTILTFELENNCMSDE